MTADRAPDDQELIARFRPVFDRIAEGAIARERSRSLPHEQVGWLRDAGFGALRVHRRNGGSGVSLTQLFRLLVLLGEADSNLVQILRAHLAFVELRLNSDESEEQQRVWFERIVRGELIGAAMAERTDATETTLKLEKIDGVWRLNGRKFYCTGTLYADWVSAAASEGDERLSVLVPTGAEGVTRLDDWDGFGQQMTGSGSTIFDNVRVEEENILRRFKIGEVRADSYITAFYQQMHLAAFAGIGRAALRDAVGFVQAKTRAFGVPGKSEPRNDPLVQRVVGKLSSLAFALESIVDGVSAALEEARTAWLAGEREGEAFVTADINAYQGQQAAIPLVLEATGLLFEVGGASATSLDRALDRHWRNARVIASHNPAIARERLLGDHYLNGVNPREAWSALWKKAATQGAEAPAGEATPVDAPALEVTP